MLRCTVLYWGHATLYAIVLYYYHTIPHRNQIEYICTFRVGFFFKVPLPPTPVYLFFYLLETKSIEYHLVFRFSIELILIHPACQNDKTTANDLACVCVNVCDWFRIFHHNPFHFDENSFQFMLTIKKKLHLYFEFVGDCFSSCARTRDDSTKLVYNCC